MSIWFAFLMLASVIPATAPTAAAAAPDISIVDSNLIIERPAGSGTWVDYSTATHGKILVGDRVSFYWNLTWPTDPCTTGSAVSPQSQWSIDDSAHARVDATFLGQTAGGVPAWWDPVQEATNNSVNQFRIRYGPKTVAPAPATNLTHADGTGKAVTLKVNLTCGENAVYVGNTAPVDNDNTLFSEQFSVDTILPTLDVTATPGLNHDLSRRAFVDGGNTAAIGTRVHLNATTNGVKLEMDTSALTDRSGYQDITTTPGHQIVEIKEAGAGTPTLAGAPAIIRLRATDVSGNTLTVDRTITVDNVRPTAPPDFAPGKADLMLSRRSPIVAGSENNNLSFNFVGTAVTHAQLLVKPGTGAEYAAGAIPKPDAGVLSSNLSFTVADDPLTPMDENQLTAWQFTIVPVDSVGNVANISTTADRNANTRAITFPTFKVRYGLSDQSPAFIGGSLLGEIDIFDMGSVPNPPAYGVEDPGHVYAQLIRESEATPQWWMVNTRGNEESHYRAGEMQQVANSAHTANTETTIMRPSGPLTSLPTIITLNNMSDRPSPNQRSYLDGKYRLVVNVSAGTGTTQRNVSHILRFATDGGAPTIGDHPLYANPRQGTVGPNTNMSQVHGMDGNPFRVLFQTSDERNSTAGLLDSGIRRVTFSLVDQAGNQALRTSDLSEAKVVLDTVDGTQWRNVPSYVYNLTTPLPTAGVFCQSSTWVSNSCIFEEVVENGTWRATWFNGTRFAGWINLTMHDLAPGNYSVRVTVEDHSGLKTTKTYSSGTGADVYYKVAPAVRILADATSPLLTTFQDGGVTKTGIQVTALASQRYVDAASNSSLDSNIRNKCRTDTGPRADICPVERVVYFVSNSDSGANAVQYGSDRLGELVPNAVHTDTVKGFVRGAYADPFNGTLSFSNTGVPMTWFYYNSTSGGNPPELPSTIDRTRQIYVRAVAYAYNAENQIVITRESDWTPVLSIGQAAVNVYSPTEWQVNVSTGATSTTLKPPFVVQFNTTDASIAPRLSYTIKSWNGGATLASASGLWPLNHSNNVLPRASFNWTGQLKYLANDSRLPQGSYYLTVEVLDATGVSPLATLTRNFTIVDARPTIAASATQDDVRLLRTGTNSFTTGRNFFISLTTSHNDLNLTGFRFTLRYPDAPAGVPSEYTSNGDGTGTNGFRVEITGGLPLPQFDATQRTRVTDIVATVTMPEGIRDGGDLIFTVTADHAPSPTSDSVLLKFDRVPPAGTLFVPDTERSILDTSTGTGGSPQRNLPHATRKPYFKGFVEDFGTGLKLIEVRLVDLTDGVTLQLDPSGGVVRKPGTNVDVWTNSSVQQNAAGQDVRLIEHRQVAPGVWHWWLNTTARTNLSTAHLYEARENQGDDVGVIKLHHRYRVDVRFTDRLDQTSTVVNSTLVDFDPSPPFLGYKNQLTVSNAVPSGISIAGTRRTLNWHGEGDSLVANVKVTDNHCIRAVRLVGTSALNPSTILKANMSPTSWTPTDRVCPNGEAVDYRIDLAGAIDIATKRHFFDDVSEYTLWWEAEDWSGQVTEIPASPVNYRTMKITVLDNTPATVSAVWFDPPVGQAGGRALIRAQVFENKQISHVLVKIGNLSANMTPENVSSTGAGVWRLDTTDDLQLALDVGEYEFNVTPYDVNWNRSTNPTCPFICFGVSPLYLVRDDGAPAVLLDTPAAGATLNATPTLKFRALHKAIETTQISVRATMDGNVSNLTAVPSTQLNFTELRSTNGTRQGWTVSYAPGQLADNTTLIVNVSAALASLVDAKQFTFVVDSLAPSVTGNATNTQTIGGKVYATRATRIVLRATDTVGSPTIKFSVNGGAEQTYTSDITPTGQDGEWKVEFWATDNAGNLGTRQTITLNLDLTGPRITVAKHGDELLVTVTDGTGVGLNESSVTAHYRYGAATAFTPRKLDKLTGNSFGTTLPGNASESGLAYYFTAEDLLTNVGSNFSAAQPYTIRRENVTPTNLPPSIRITSPTAATQVSGSVELRWLAEDPEEAPLTISIALRDPAPGRVLVAAGENSGSYTLNTTGFATGAYTVVVTANDGENSASAQVTFNVENTPVIQARNVPPATVLPNTPVSVAVALNPVGKTVAQAQYRLLKDGQLFTSGLLAPSQGLYGAAFTPSEPGNYAVVVSLVYADGTTEPPQQVATFRVPGTATPPGEGEGRGAFPVSLMALAAIAVLTIALAAYGAFGRWKK